MNIFSTRATNVRAKSIINVAVYPPVASSTLFDAVATNEPTITVKVISAILPEKYFMPKNDDVNAAVIVGQAPYDIPVRHTPIIQRGRAFIDTESNVTAAAQIVRIFAQIIVLRQPITSNTAPVIIRPRPLQTESIPTRETARVSGAFTESARSLWKAATYI